MTALNKRIIVTGGPRGIAAAAVASFVRAGAHVATLGISEEPGRKLTAEGPGTVTYFPADVSDRTAVSEASHQGSDQPAAHGLRRPDGAHHPGRTLA
ncbi:SDR family NAD(P)-dependent oxidoreductase [Streptomyces sp. NPDC059818]|uniref:SDR family NAD(P)-dependent oxidoreductase n=1 Tax=Streptomyces sp. NPDC059818 TaxID=3346962 RepID=UPI0036488E7C